MTIREILAKYEKALREALVEELEYAKVHGFEQGHYWLHRKIDQIIDEAEDHFIGGQQTPYF